MHHIIDPNIPLSKDLLQIRVKLKFDVTLCMHLPSLTCNSVRLWIFIQACLTARIQITSSVCVDSDSW